jgi:hypothetical protein
MTIDQIIADVEAEIDRLKASIVEATQASEDLKKVLKILNGRKK